MANQPSERRLAVYQSESAFALAWGVLPEEAQTKLSQKGLHDPSIWNALLEGMPTGAQMADFANGLCGALTDSGMQRWTELGPDLVLLGEASAAAAAARESGVAQLCDLAMIVERAERQRASRGVATTQDLKRLEAESLAFVPKAWTGREVRRPELADSTGERAAAEKTQRARWAKEVAGILVEAQLPFARQAGDLLGDALTRCCRGLRAKTLAKRVRAWRPFRRYLIAQTATHFPTDIGSVLHYLELAAAGGAAQSFYGNFLTSLKFFEEAGEQVSSKLLHLEPALVNLVKEQKALTPKLPGRGGQAPPYLLNILAAVERVVVDEAQKDFIRFFGWVFLVRHWAALRVDDCAGIRPADIEKRRRGTSGRLERTKVSGPGKATLVLPWFISDSCFLVEEGWMGVGLGLLQREDFGFPRDYLIPLANSDLSGPLRRRAEYSDVAGYQKALLGHLLLEDGRFLLPLPAAVAFWTTHSARSGLDSWVAAMGAQESERSFLGRWAKKGSTDSYVRTALRVVENLQVSAALEAARAFRGGADTFGEEEVLASLRSLLVSKGYLEEAVADQLLRLTAADFNLRPGIATPTGAEPDHWSPGLFSPTNGPSQPGTPTVEADSGTEMDVPNPSMIESLRKRRRTEPEVLLEEVSGIEASEASDSEDDLEAAEIDEARKAQLPVELEAPAGFVISKTSSKLRRLHFVGSCSRVPGIHYHSFEAWGQTCPPEGEYDLKCINCFGRSVPTLDGSGSSSEDSGSSGSEDSSSTEVGASWLKL